MPPTLSRTIFRPGGRGAGDNDAEDQRLTGGRIQDLGAFCGGPLERMVA